MTTGDKPISLIDTATGEAVDFSVAEFLKLAYASVYRQTLCRFLGDISTSKKFDTALSEASPQTLEAQVSPILAVIEKNSLAIKKGRIDKLLGKWQLYDASLDNPGSSIGRREALSTIRDLALGGATVGGAGLLAYAAREIKEPPTRDDIKLSTTTIKPVSEDGTVIVPPPACVAAPTP